MLQADANDVALTLPTGEVILRDGSVKKPPRASDVARRIENGAEAKQTLQRLHRKLGDMPAEPQQMNAIAVVLAYSAVGMSDEDIATSLSTSLDNVKRVKAMDAYKQFEEMFDERVFEDARSEAKHIIAKAATTAAERTVELVSSNDEAVALSAARDIHKINGLQDNDKVSTAKGGLRIEVIRRDGEQEDTITVSVGE